MKRTVMTTLAVMLLLMEAAALTTIEINYSGTTASVRIPDGVTDVTAVVNGANVTINSATTSTEYAYRLTGSTADGSLIINGSYKLTLQLAGVTLTNAHGGAAIDVECGKRIAVELVEGTVNTLADVSGTQKATLYIKGHAEFEGLGMLNVTGKVKHAICAKEYMELKASTGIINILGAPSDGLHCGKGKVNDENNYFLMKGGTVNIMNVGGDGVDSDDYGTIHIEGGAISINVGNEATGLKADSIITISGGTVNMAVGGNDSEGMRSRYRTDISGGRMNIVVTGNGSKAVKGKRYTANSTVLNGGYVNITGGNTEIKVLGGNYTDPATGEVSKCMAINADADLEMTGGTVSITALGKEAYTYSTNGNKRLTGGKLDIVRTPWRINTADYRYDMTVCLAVTRGGVRLTDFSQKAVGAFMGTQCVGYALFPSSDYGFMRIYSNTASAGSVSFRLYDYDTETEYTVTPAHAVSFTSMTTTGTPNSPLMLSYSGYCLGDANHDGKVDIVDVTSIISHILGQTPAVFHIAEADVNLDGTINIVDVTSVISMILNTN